nr:response regulator transcription factor [uncultured Aminipila sp.]
MNTILIIEDDQVLNKGLKYDLEAEGYQILSAFHMEEGKNIYCEKQIDLVVLDVNLPDGDGFDFCKWAKAQNEKAPIIFLTARDLEKDAVKGYDLGAEDYVTKPFSVVLLRKKIAVILKRFENVESLPDYDDGFLSVSLGNMDVCKRQERVNLTPTEHKLLKIFLTNPRQLLTHDMLIEKVWDTDSLFMDKHALAVNINRVRNKIEDVEHTYISNVYGMGYQWAGEKE